MHVSVGHGHGRAYHHAANCRRDAHPADAAGVPGDARHRCGPYESGPGGTRVTYTAGQAAFGAAKDLRDKLRAVAAELLEGPVESVQLSQGQFVLAGNPPRALSVAEVVAQAIAGTGSPLRGAMSVTSTPPHVTAFCAQAAEVEVDPDTGQVTVKKIGHGA